MQFPIVDYANHPAYGKFVGQTNYDERFINEKVGAVDALINRFCQIALPVREEAEDGLQQIARELLVIQKHVKAEQISILAEEWLHNCVEWVVKDLSEEFARRVFWSDERLGNRLTSESSRQFAEMNERGMYISELPSESYAEIRRYALEYLPDLREKALADRFNRSVISVPFNSPLWNAIKRGAVAAGILDVLSHFKRNNMSILGTGLEYSCSQQNWYQSLYGDVGIDDSPLQYMHVDETDGYPKSMIYVTPVDVDNGPTRAIPKSHRWHRSECQIRFHKALDRIVTDRYVKFAKQAHYRPLARHSELRRVFMQLPKAFQGSSHFGDDVLAGTPMAEDLLACEVPFISSGNQALVFDGPHLLHRGSLVKEGERLALQVIYRHKNEGRIKAHLSNESFFGDQVKLLKRYGGRIVRRYV